MFEPTVVARSWELVLAEGATGSELAEKAAELLTRVAADLKAAGCALIGHLKCLVDAGECCLFVSATRFGQAPRVKGSLPGTVARVRLDVNAIVFGVPPGAVSEMLEQGVETVFGHAVRGAAAPS